MTLGAAMLGDLWLGFCHITESMQRLAILVIYFVSYPAVTVNGHFSERCLL